MNEFIESNHDLDQKKRTPRTAEELRAEYVPEMGEGGEPRGRWMNLIILEKRMETIQKISAPFKKHREAEAESIAGSLTFTNPTGPIVEEGIQHASVRVEQSETEKSSRIEIFKQVSPAGDDWREDEELPVFPNMQDPFHCGMIEGYQIFGGVQIFEKEGGGLEWRTVFYRYKDSMKELVDPSGKLVKPFCFGPMGMKDVRLKELSSGRIAVFTRPQGEFGGRGKVGYLEISNLEDLESTLQKHDKEKNPSTLIEGLFSDENWGGANELHTLSDGRIGVIGHIACMEEDPKNPKHGVKDYYAIAFIFDPETKDFSDLKVIVTAEDFPEVEGKKEDIGSVIFSGGIKRLGNGRAIFYGGVKDVRPGYLPIRDPFGDL